MIRALWRGEEVTTDGPLPAEKAKLWCLPEKPPRIYATPLSAETAAWAGTWADGIITVRSDIGTTKDIIHAFRANGGAGKPVALQYQLSWAPDVVTATKQAHDQWRHVGIPADSDVSGCDTPTPEAFDALSEDVTPRDIRRNMMISSQPDIILEDIRHYADLGFDEIYLHNAGRNQKEFIECFCENVLPKI
jgi:alkanesulfonate monooxygenase SsuD/methylene tetrahydromethanopterin reductase-like flavin-dependent oxidoreductase (luciferase family)